MDSGRPFYRLLGPLRVDRAPGTFGYDNGKTEGLAVLAAMLVGAPKIVPKRRLIEDVWPSVHGFEPDERKLRAIIARLRRGIGDNEITTDGGYGMPGAVERRDTAVFRRLRSEAQAARENKNPELARDLFREALELWRGTTALQNLQAYKFAAAFARVWDDLRATTVTDLLDVLNELGRADELEELLGREAGVIPDRIAEWRQRRRTHVVPPTGSLRVAGRDAVIDELHAVAVGAWQPDGPATRIVRISGPAGVGITTVMEHVCARLAREHARIIPVNMRGTVDIPMSATYARSKILIGLGTPPDDLPEDPGTKKMLYADRLTALRRSDRVVVVLDHVSRAEQVNDLLEIDAHWTVFVCSRPELPGVRPALALPVELAPLDVAGSLEILRKELGGEAVDRDLGAARRLVERCERIPLFIEIAAAWIATSGKSVAWGAETIDQERREKPGLAGAQVLQFSVQDLPPAQKRALALLGQVRAQSVTTSRMAALLGTTEEEAAGILAGLAHARLLIPGAERFPLRPVVQAYAGHLPHDGWEDARRRLLDSMLAEVRGVAGPLTPATGARRTPAWDWYEAEGVNLVGAVDQAAEAREDELCWRLVDAIRPILYLTGAAEDWTQLVAAAMGAADRLGDPIARARILMARADLERYAGAWDEAYDDYDAAVRLSGADRGTRAEALDGRADLGIGRYTRDGDRAWLGRAEDDARQSHRLFEEMGNRQGAASALTSLAEAQALADRNAEAAETTRRSLQLYRSVPDRVHEAVALRILGSVHQRLGEPAEAERNLAEAVRANDAANTRLEGARARVRLAGVRLHLGRHAAAREALGEAMVILDRGPDLRWRAIGKMTFGELLLGGEDPAGAIAPLLEAVALFERLGEEGGAERARELLAEARSRANG